MDRKAAGVADVIADLSVGDDELQNAANRLKKNREKKELTEDSKRKVDGGPKLVPAIGVEKPDTESTSFEPPKQAAKAKPKTPSQKHALPKEWSTATATLNTRVPPEMDQLLDDLLAKQRREWKTRGQKGNKPTKQAIIQQALEAYFRSSPK